MEEEALIEYIELKFAPIWKKILYSILVLISGGLFYLLCRWLINLKIKITLSDCPLELSQILKIKAKGIIIWIL